MAKKINKKQKNSYPKASQIVEGNAKIGKSSSSSDVAATQSSASNNSTSRIRFFKKTKSTTQKLIRPKLPRSFTLLTTSFRTIKNHWKIFGGITLIYIILTFVLVRGLGNSGTDIQKLKSVFDEVYQGPFAGASATASLFTSLLLSGSTVQSPSGSVYQSLLLVLISLATIWGLRQVLAHKKITIRDTFYKGMYPLVPFILVLLVIGLQLIPLAVGSWLYGVVIGGAIAGSYIELALWLCLIIALVIMTLYMITSSIFALFIVTLPDMTPLQALRSAKQLVAQRRWTVMSKILFLPLALLILSVVIMLPIIIALSMFAEIIFVCISLFGWIVVLSYIYTLYRELLNE